MAMIEIEGKKYKVVETLPYHGAGRLTKVIDTPDGEKIVVKDYGKWRFWIVDDRLGK